MILLQPALTKKKSLNILCLGAHSDDIEIGCGGTLLSLLAAKQKVHLTWVVFSGDGKRASEAESSAIEYLNKATSAEFKLFPFRDGYFPDQWAEIKTICASLAVEFLGKNAPDIIFTHRRDDSHQDHRVISELTLNHWRNQLLLEYEIPKYDGDLTPPNCFVPLTAAQAKKKTALLMKYFATQRNKHWFDESLFLGLMRLRGVECAAASGYAEGFHCRKMTLGW